MVTIARGHAVIAIPMAVLVVCLVSVLPSLANLTPESALLMHVQPVSGTCATSITNCNQIVRSTPASGAVEFVIFFMRGSYFWPGETVCFERIVDKLMWPSTWTCTGGQACGGGGMSLWAAGGDVGGDHVPNVYWLELTGWSNYAISGVSQGVVPVARLTFDVGGPGRLEMTGTWSESEVMLRHDCDGSELQTFPNRIYAEAGMECGYVESSCGYENTCAPVFIEPVLHLVAPVGSAAAQTVAYHANASCNFSVNSDAAWCWAQPLEYMGSFHRLYVLADAAGLSQGTYHALVTVESSSHTAARCLPVVFDVEAAVAAESRTWGAVKALYR